MTTQPPTPSSPERIRVLRLLEYEGPRDIVLTELDRRGVKDTCPPNGSNGRVTIRETFLAGTMGLWEYPALSPVPIEGQAGVTISKEIQVWCPISRFKFEDWQHLTMVFKHRVGSTITPEVGFLRDATFHRVYDSQVIYPVEFLNPLILNRT